MPASALHRDAIIVDGLIIANFGHAVFADMKRGGLTAANCTCSVWEGFRASMDNIVRWQGWFRDHGDLIMPVRTSADILRAKKIGKVGIILGWQICPASRTSSAISRYSRSWASASCK